MGSAKAVHPKNNGIMSTTRFGENDPVEVILCVILHIVGNTKIWSWLSVQPQDEQIVKTFLNLGKTVAKKLCKDIQVCAPAES